MDSSFDSLKYESDISESSESVKSAKSRGRGRPRISARRDSISSTHSQAIRRSHRLSTLTKEIEPNANYDDGNNDTLKKSNVAMHAKTIDLSNGSGHENGNEDFKILGATEVNGELHFMFTRKDQDAPQIISNKDARIKYPQELMAFYESCMVWDVSEEEVDVNEVDGTNGK